MMNMGTSLIGFTNHSFPCQGNHEVEILKGNQDTETKQEMIEKTSLMDYKKVHDRQEALMALAHLVLMVLARLAQTSLKTSNL